MPYRKGRTQTYSPQNRKPKLTRIYQRTKPRKGVWYCPKCVDEQKSCPYYFKPGKCPEHPRTKLVFDPELTEMLRKEKKL
jgi:hypothetical protein